jgi:hypothetical protein
MNRLALASLALAGALMLQPPARADETIGTFTLDGFSFVSFGDREVLTLPAGSTLRFRFGAPQANGSIPFTIRPEDVTIAAIPLPASAGTLRYAIASTASGSMWPTAQGRQVSFQATVRASLDSPERNGSYDYAVPFTTETVAASNRAGTETEQVTGMRLVDGVWYGQIVGATTNKDAAFPEPGAAVYTVLSGSFDRVP